MAETEKQSKKYVRLNPDELAKCSDEELGVLEEDLYVDLAQVSSMRRQRLRAQGKWPFSLIDK